MEIKDNITKLFDKSKEWINKNGAILIEENRPSLLKAINYKTIEGKISEPLIIELNKNMEGVLIKIKMTELGSTPRFLFQKYKDLPLWILIEDYFTFIGIQFNKENLKKLYPNNIIYDSIIGSIFLSSVCLTFSVIGIKGFLNFYPQFEIVIFIGLFLVMIWFGFPHLYSLIKILTIIYKTM